MQSDGPFRTIAGLLTVLGLGRVLCIDSLARCQHRLHRHNLGKSWSSSTPAGQQAKRSPAVRGPADYLKGHQHPNLHWQNRSQVRSTPIESPLHSLAESFAGARYEEAQGAACGGSPVASEKQGFSSALWMSLWHRCAAQLPHSR